MITEIVDFEKHLKEITSLRPNTINKYVLEIKKFYDKRGELTLENIKKHVSNEHKKHNSRAKFALKNYLFYKNKNEWYASLYPLKLLARKKIVKHYDAQTMINIINNIKRHHFKYAANLQLFSGARASEIFSMRAENIDLNYKHNLREDSKSEVSIHALVSGKGGAERHLIFPIETRPIFNSLLYNKTNGYIFLQKEYDEYTFAKKCRSLVSMYEKQIKDSAKSLGHPAFNTHDLRRGYANIAIMKGSNLITIKELLGHKSVQTTTLYLHRDAIETDTAITKINDVLINNINNIRGGRVDSKKEKQQEV